MQFYFDKSKKGLIYFHLLMTFSFNKLKYVVIMMLKK